MIFGILKKWKAYPKENLNNNKRKEKKGGKRTGEGEVLSVMMSVMEGEGRFVE